MTTQDIIDHLKAGRPLTKNVAKEIIRELERVKALEEALRFIVDECDWEPGCGDSRIGLSGRKALEATCQK